MVINFLKLTDDEVEKVCKEALRYAWGIPIYSSRLDVQEVEERRIEWTYGNLFIVYAPSVNYDKIVVYPDTSGMCGMFCNIEPDIVFRAADVYDKMRCRE